MVKPRISGLNITGLGTLLSGNYIAVGLGQSQESERHFVALETPPPIATDTPGRFYMLKTPVLGSLGEGTPIYFREVAGRPGGVLRNGQEWPVPEREDICTGTLRPIRQPGHAFLAGERD